VTLDDAGDTSNSSRDESSGSGNAGSDDSVDDDSSSSGGSSSSDDTSSSDDSRSIMILNDGDSKGSFDLAACGLRQVNKRRTRLFLRSLIT